MIECAAIIEVRREITELRASRSGGTLGFVPTMGALHAGHISLLQAAREECELVAVSIFVNPTQFGPGEDFEKYPRSMAEDLTKCRSAGVDLVFRPDAGELYPDAALTRVHVTGVSEPLCGRHRPGHFDGVALIVAKLFNIVQPDRAYFGQKDAQQLAVIRRMVHDLDMPVEIVGCPIVREADGLALSSRNAYLGAGQRRQASVLQRALLAMREAIRAGQKDADQIVRQARKLILEAGPCEIDYVELVHTQTVQPVKLVHGPVLAVLAVRIGECRFIDNLLIDGDPDG